MYAKHRIRPVIEKSLEMSGNAPASTTTLTPRPGLEYQYGFDICAAQIYRTEGSVIAFVSGTFPAHELSIRLAGREITMIYAGTQDTRGFSDLSLRWQPINEIQTGSHIIIWAFPIQDQAEIVLPQIDRWLLPGGSMYMIVNGGLASILSGRSGKKDHEINQRASLIQANYWLAQRRVYKLSRIIGTYGLASLIYGMLAGRAQKLGRQDLADRFYFEMRERLLVSGWQARFSYLAVVITKKRI